jgi:tRNA A37 threonylcarbamoyladenosine dehydratase
MNIDERFSRARLLIGSTGIEKLSKARVSIVGLGGVGSYVVEGLARAGVGHFQLIDFDRVRPSDINRQLIASQTTIGRYKSDVAKQRVSDINPDAMVEEFREFLCKENRLEILNRSDYIVDAIDSIGPKMGLLKDLCDMDIGFISVLGAGNRLDPESIKITSIWETQGCPFAKRLKKLLRRNDVSRDFRVVYSTEIPMEIDIVDENQIPTQRANDTTIPKSLVGSISYIPAIMGMMATGWIVRKIIGMEE